MLSRCPVCKAPIDSTDIICKDCRAQLDSECFDFSMSRCPMCFYPKLDDLYICERCEGGIYNKVFPVARYDGSLGYSVLYSFKFHGHKEMARVAALYLSRAFKALDPEAKAILVPVPCSKERLKLLGWDPMVEVCKATRRRFLQLLVNSDDQRIQQKRLSRQERIKAAEGRFAVNHRYEKELDELKQEKIIVVDDIITTMSTMNSAIAFLKGKGFQDVSGASWLCELRCR